MFLLIMLFSMLYLFGSGITGKQINAIGQHRCDNKNHDWEHCGHYYTGILGGAFWPLAIPLAIGMKTSDSVPTPIAKEMKAEQKRQDELKEVQHRVQVEQAQLMEEEMLDKRLTLSVRRGEQEKRLLELSAAGVDTDAIDDEVDAKMNGRTYQQPRKRGRYASWED